MLMLQIPVPQPRSSTLGASGGIGALWSSSPRATRKILWKTSSLSHSFFMGCQCSIGCDRSSLIGQACSLKLTSSMGKR